MAVSLNGYPVLTPAETVVWVIPLGNGKSIQLRLKPGHVGFLLAYLALWFHVNIEPLNTQKVPDDWGYANRPVTGGTQPSNHASGTAIDLNATIHPYRKVNSFPLAKQVKIRAKLAALMGVIRWGGDYQRTKDDMHFEINKPFWFVSFVAGTVRYTVLGKRIKAANPHYRY